MNQYKSFFITIFTLLNFISLPMSPEAAGRELLKVISQNKKTENIEDVEALIKEGANLEVRGEYRDTPLIRAAALGSSKTVKSLIKGKADLNARDISKRTPLIQAAVHNHPDVLETLIKAGADLDAQDQYHNTALFAAVSAKHIVPAKLLLKASADPNIPGDWRAGGGITPLYSAARSGNVELVQALIDAGANILQRSRVLQRGRETTAFGAAKGQEEIIALLEKGLNDRSARLMEAIIANDKIAIEAVLKSGTDPNMQDKNGITPLIKAAVRGNRDIVQLLLDNGADPNYQSSTGSTALMASVFANHKNILELLLGKKANPNVASKTGVTALMKAVDYNRNEMVKLLLKAGAYENLQDHSGQSAFDRAKKKPTILALLKFAKRYRDKNKPTKEELFDAEEKIIDEVKDDKDRECVLFFSPEDLIIEQIGKDIDAIGPDGYVGVESPEVTNDKLLYSLREAAKRGARVWMYIDPKHQDDIPPAIENSPIKIYYIENLHAKRVIIAENIPTNKLGIIGKAITYLGSMNMTINAPDNYEVMVRCTDHETFKQNYNDQSMLNSVSYKREQKSVPIETRRTTNSFQNATIEAKRQIIREIGNCSHDDDKLYIASMTFDDKDLMQEIIKAQKSFKKPIKVIVDREAWRNRSSRFYILKPMVKAGANVYVFNKDGQEKTSQDQIKLMHMKVILRICNEQCLSVISTGNLTKENERTINHDFWEPCSKAFAKKLEDQLEKIIERSERLSLASFN